MLMRQVSPNQQVSKEFYDLIKTIGETRSKQEEDRLLENEIAQLAVRFKAPGLTNKELKELAIRALYCHMLGHDVSFCHVKVLSLAADKSCWGKRTGYLLASQSLPENSEFLLLLVNTIQKDLTSAKYCNVSAALTVISDRLHLEAIPILLPLITQLLDHPKDFLKKKALCALHYVYRRAPSILSQIEPNLKKLVQSNNASVLLALLSFFRCIYFTTPEFFCEDYVEILVPQVVAIIQNILNGRVEGDEILYHKVPAPWLQITCMRLLVLIVRKNAQLSEECYEILRMVLRKNDLSSNIAFAIHYECILTIAALYPHPLTCNLAAQSIGTFVESKNRNLRLSGLTGLAKLVEIEPTFIGGHQLTIIDSLEDSDETVRTKALHLLAQTTNSSNVVAVVDKLIASADMYSESSLRTVMVSKAFELNDRFAPSPEEYLVVVYRLMKSHPKHFTEDNMQQFISVVADGPGEEEEEDNSFRHTCLKGLLEVLESVDSEHSNIVTTCIWCISYCIYTDVGRADSIYKLLLESIKASYPYFQRQHRVLAVTSLLNILALMAQQANVQCVETWEPFRQCEAIVELLMKAEWDITICDRMAEFRCGRWSRLWPVLGLTEDVSRYLEMAVIEAACAHVQETAAMKELVLARSTRNAASPAAAEGASQLSFRPYESNTRKPAVLSPTQKPPINQFAVKLPATGNRWTLAGLKPLEPAVAPAAERPPTRPSTASDFKFVSRASNTANTARPDSREEARKKEDVKKKEAGILFAGII